MSRFQTPKKAAGEVVRGTMPPAIAKKPQYTYAGDGGPRLNIATVFGEAKKEPAKVSPSTVRHSSADSIPDAKTAAEFAAPHIPRH